MIKYFILFMPFFWAQFCIGQTKPEFHACHHAQWTGPMPSPTSSQLREIQAGKERSDTFDIKNYKIFVDATNYSGKKLKGTCTVRFQAKMNNLNHIRFDLTKLGIDSVYRTGDGMLIYTYTDPIVDVFLGKTLNTGDIDSVSFIYSGTPYQDPVWGGVYFANNIIYNLGIGLSSNPPNFGRVWYPCFDNFVERATYEISILSNSGRKGYSIGTFLGQQNLGADSIVRHYRMNQLLPTYLTNFAASNYAEVNFSHTSPLGTVPIQLVGKPNDTLELKQAFSNIGVNIDAMEKWFGKYAWERVGYVMTTVGAMEHPTNIAYPENVIQGGSKTSETLMAHEFGHNWWGNITTLTEAQDMWIKEGNAEYSSHLFLDHVYGRKKFIDAVKSNHRNVLVFAHQEDGKYEPLSGISFGNIYGRHTYWKGAAVMHNLRTYMQDSLYKIGMQSILSNYAYSSVNATQFKDQLEASTGLDLNDFFEDQILQPGFVGFEIDSVEYEEGGNGKIANVHLEQKTRATTHPYGDVPMKVSFYNQEWKQFKARITAKGIKSSSKIQLPVGFNPVLVFLNEDNDLNLAQLQQSVKLKIKQQVTVGNVDFIIKVNEIKDTAFLSVQHMWVAPDPIKVNPFNAKISNSHYWIVGGIFPEVFKATGTLEYQNNSENAFLDADLVSITEDSLILVYRKDATEDWKQFPYYTPVKLSLTDGKGFIRIDSLRQGEYAFANGFLDYVSTNEVKNLIDLKLSPNPCKDYFIINGLDTDGNFEVIISDITGRQVQHLKDLNYNNSGHSVSLPPNLPFGSYTVQVWKNRQLYGTSQIIKE